MCSLFPKVTFIDITVVSQDSVCIKVGVSLQDIAVTQTPVKPEIQILVLMCSLFPKVTFIDITVVSQGIVFACHWLTKL